MKQPTKTYAPADCAWCKATGMVNVAPGVPASCIVCGGKGHISVAQPSGPCRQCEGSGRRSISNLCFTCAGTGWEYISNAAPTGHI